MEEIQEETRLPGVFAAKKKNGAIYYRSSLTYRRRHISLGSFSTCKEAHCAYLEAWNLLNNKELTLDMYSEKGILFHEKWVSLLNFRDNGIYFSNPIYTRTKHFLYYLDSKTTFVFDIDDLFYYSSHKIMRRNGHFFVADYGMQYNILNRYGIRNYSVKNRDYRFINGNSYDFRYENIEIINRYQGVRRIHKNNATLYKVQVHVRSYYQVGVYQDEISAAVAYNKAIDILKKNGILKNYTPNFVEGITNAEYARIYADLPVSPKLNTLTPSTIKLK